MLPRKKLIALCSTSCASCLMHDTSHEADLGRSARAVAHNVHVQSAQKRCATTQRTGWAPSPVPLVSVTDKDHDKELVQIAIRPYFIMLQHCAELCVHIRRAPARAHTPHQRFTRRTTCCKSCGMQHADEYSVH